MIYPIATGSVAHATAGNNADVTASTILFIRCSTASGHQANPADQFATTFAATDVVVLEGKPSIRQECTHDKRELPAEHRCARRPDAEVVGTAAGYEARYLKIEAFRVVELIDESDSLIELGDRCS